MKPGSPKPDELHTEFETLLKAFFIASAKAFGETIRLVAIEINRIYSQGG